jgi:hypothetical protein
MVDAGRGTVLWIGAIVLLAGVSGCEGTGAGSGFAFGPQPGDHEDVWAIRCITLKGPGRFELAETYAAALKKVDGLRPNLVQVISDEDGAHVFYGRYRREYGADAGPDRYRPDALPDLERIRTLMMQMGGEAVWPFILATIDLLPTYRSAHPEWNLENADGYWAYHVAVFYNTETMRTRRSAAEEYCRILREQGEPAYFHHAAVHSSVYVGTYPEGAVVEVREENPFSGAVTTRMRIVDPEMLAVQQRFPHSLHNGHLFYDIVRDPATGEVTQRLPAPSFPVVTPKAQRLIDELGGV